jgi:hypothetical protein
MKYTVVVNANNNYEAWFPDNYKGPESAGFHRLDGPARISKDDFKEWWVDGKIHREDGPALEYANGTKCWYINDLRHREDGPAVERPNGKNEWYINGKVLTEEQFNARNNTCDGKIVEIEGKKYKLTLV